MELPVFLMTGFHPAGFILGYILGLHEEVHPVFCIRANDIQGLQNITVNRLCVVSSLSEIPTNGIGIGRFMDDRTHLRDGYDPYNKLMQLAPEHGFEIKAHPILFELVQVGLEPDPSVCLAQTGKTISVGSIQTGATPADLMAPSNDGIISETVMTEETQDEHSGHAVDDSVPTGEPQGDGAADTARDPVEPIKIGKRSKG